MLCERPEPFRTRAPLSRTGLLRLTAARLSCRTAPRTHDTRDYLRAGAAAPATTLPLNVLFFQTPQPQPQPQPVFVPVLLLQASRSTRIIRMMIHSVSSLKRLQRQFISDLRHIPFYCTAHAPRR